MLAYFPELYEDELLYSIYARYYVHSGHMTMAYALSDLFGNDRARVDFLFTNKLSSNAIQCLNKNESFENKHTMLPYYNLFKNGGYSPVKTKRSWMRYCPDCVKEDREKYGETYWHREHQIPEIKVCCKHRCKLCDGALRNDRKLITAESVVNDDVADYNVDESELGLAMYVIEIFRNYDKLSYDNLIGDFFMNKLRSTTYASKRGQFIDIKRFSSDVINYYRDRGCGLDKEWQVAKVLHNERVNPFEVCQIGYFLGLSVNEMIEMKMDDDTFDKMVMSRIKNGESMYHLAKDLDVSASLIHQIRDSQKDVDLDRIKRERDFWLKVVEKHKNMTYTELRSIPEYFPHLNWLRRHDKEWTDAHYPNPVKKTALDDKLKELDDKLLPDVKRVIGVLLEKDKEIPERISTYKINNMLGLKRGERLYRLPKCLSEIEKYEESQEEFWCRKAIWAAEQMLKDGERLNFKRFRSLTCMKKDQLAKCYSLLLEDGSNDVIRLVDSLIAS